MKRALSALGVASVLLALGSVGCARKSSESTPPAPRMTEKEVVSLANAALKKEGYRAYDYHHPEVSYDSDGVWRLNYRYEVDMPGGWVGVLVWEKTGAIEILPGH